jgi:hypothetical protein
MPRPRSIATCDCETDPFLHRRIPKPFIWGFYDGREFQTFDSTDALVEYIKPKRLTLYAHNGGKFDFMYLLSHVGETTAQIINGRIVCMKLGETELVDSYAAIPEALGDIKKDKIEYWKMEKEYREQYREEILSYLRGDCVYLYELMSTYRKIGGHKKTIASNALTHAKKLGIEPGTTNHRFDANYRPFYFGGRTECFRPGSHEHISVLDIKSSYPNAMMYDHPTGGYMYRQNDFTGLDRDAITRSMIILKCFANGCFPLRTQTSEGLKFPKAHNEYRVTGWEYLAAKDLGLIDDEQIIEVRYTDQKITFRDYVLHWYEYKNAHPKKQFPIEYAIGKRFMNSLYGKMAQNPERYHDYKIVADDTQLPCDKPIVDKTGKCRVCGFPEMDHGWLFYTTFEGRTFHRRESLWKYRYRFGIEWEAKPLYKNVATGASITGFARAALLRAMHAIGAEHVIYCDTDSLVVDRFADHSILPQSDKIGDWELEIKRAPIGHFCGKKLYAIDIDPTKKCGCETRNGQCDRHKVVTKGGRLTFKEMEKLAAGEDIFYEPQAPSYSLANGIDFVDRTFRRTSSN